MTGALLDLRPLRSSPAFRRLWIGTTLSGFGSQMTLVAVMYQVWQQTGSTVWTGAVGLAQALPVVVFGLFAGALADRAERRRLALLTTAGCAACTGLLAVQGLLGPAPVMVVLVLVAVQSCVGAAGGPVARSYLPHLLRREQLGAGLALNHLSFQASMLVGPAVGGLVLGWSGVSGCYLVDTVSFGLAFVGVRGLPALPPAGGPAVSGARAVADGLRFLAGHRVVRTALLTDLAATVLAMPISLFALMNTTWFDGDPRTFGLFLTAIAVGGLIASALSGTYSGLARPQPVMLGASAVWGAALALFGLAGGPWLGLGCLVVAGAADTVAVVSRGTVVQLHTPAGLLGRVAAAEQIVGQAGPDLGNMRAGLVARLTSGPVALASGGVLCVLAVTALAAGGGRRQASGAERLSPDRA